MGRKRSGTRALFARLFVRPYEPVHVYGSVHNLARVGGVSIFSVGREFAPGDLVVPTRFAATAQYLCDHGGNTPGLFRIPGQTRTIAQLREHFMSHMYLENYSTHESDVEVTIRLAALPSPSTLPYNIHDVASTFKHFLGELHGGILGSVDVFDSLKKALIPVKPQDSDLDFQCRGIGGEEDAVNARWVARVLCSVECAQRRNLILTVFGLLAYIRHDRDRVRSDSLTQTYSTQVSTRFNIPEQVKELSHTGSGEIMSSKALGVVFAPLLLGNLTDEIELDVYQRSSSVPQGHRHSLLGSHRNKISKSMSMVHIKRSSLTTTFPTMIPVTLLEPLSNERLQDQRLTHASMIFNESGEKSRLPLMQRMRSRAGQYRKKDDDLLIPLGEGVERNKIATKMVVLLIRNWESVVKALRDAGCGSAEQGPWRMEKSESDGIVKVRRR